MHRDFPSGIGFWMRVFAPEGPPLLNSLFLFLVLSWRTDFFISSTPNDEVDTNSTITLRNSQVNSNLQKK
jgi:hypothetical protein